MNFLLINGSCRKNGATSRAMIEVKRELLRLGGKTENYEIGSSPRYACSACGGCKNGKGCIYRDIDALAEKCNEANAIIIGTPTHYAAPPGNLTSVLSRLLFSAKKSVSFKPVGVIGVGRRGGICEAVRDVKKFFEFASCPIISGCYPSILYANDFESADADGEGLQNMRSLADNIYYITHCIEVGNKNGILPPDEEVRIKTDIPSLKRH